jgi:hypothetical protein
MIVRHNNIRTLKICPEPEEIIEEVEETEEEEEVQGDNMLPLFGTALNNIGYLYDEFTNNPDWNTFIETVGFTEGAYTAGAEDHWIHPVSKKGGFLLFPDNMPLTTLESRVGMGANLNEIYNYTSSTVGAYKTHKNYNSPDIDTGIAYDFLPLTTSYATNHNQKFIFTANATHGDLPDLQTFLAEIIPVTSSLKVRYGNEVSVGNSGSVPGTSLKSDQYLVLVERLHDWMKDNHPEIPTVINAADHTTGTCGTVNAWCNEDIAAFALEEGIQEFSQYFWMGDNGGNVPVVNNNAEINAYFTLALTNTRGYKTIGEGVNPPGNNSLYGEILPRLQVYYNMFYPTKMHVGQYGCSLQRSGYIANTMLHGLMIGNIMFEFFKFNYTHNNFINSAVFLVNESAVDLKTSQDNNFNIHSSYQLTSGGDTFVKRIQGVIYELFKPLSTHTADYPIFIPVTFTNQPDKLDAVAFEVNSEVYLWIYNILDAETLLSIEVDASPISSDLDIDGAYSTELYGSIGTCPAYGQFKDLPENSPFTPVDIEPIQEDNFSSTNVPIQEHSFMKIKLLTVTTASNITLNF